MASPPPTRHPVGTPAGAVAVLVVAAVLAGCAGDDDASVDVAAPATAAPATTAPATPSACTEQPVPATTGDAERVEVRSGDDDRWYLRSVPSGYDGTPAPLVVDLHGYLSGAAGQAALSDLASTGEEHGFVVATPEGSGALVHWNAVPHDDLPDDVGFVADVIGDVEADVCIDPRRVYVTGFSNGAFLASLVACRLADRVAAVAAVAGLLLPEGCEPARPVAVLAIHGTEDRYVDVDGAPGPALAGLDWDEQSRAAFAGLPYAPVDATAARWAEANGCSDPPVTTAVAEDVERTDHLGCEGDADVVLLLVDGGGHTWPGSAVSQASEAILGPTTTSVDADEVIWAFFADHPMP